MHLSVSAGLVLVVSGNISSTDPKVEPVLLSEIDTKRN